MTAPMTVAEVGAALDRLGPLASFPWHRQQQRALASATDTIIILGGSGAGKSSVGMGMLARLMRREGPIYRRLRNADTRPLKIWVAPLTGEKAQSVWEPLLRTEAFAGMTFSYVQSPHRVFTWADHVSTENTLWVKSQEQGLLAFESDEVDAVLFDEEPLDKRLFGAASARLRTTHGVIICAFTPLHGLTWTYSAFYTPCVRPEFQRGDRVWRQGSHLTVIQMGMADNPAAVAGGGVERLLHDPTITEAERNARLFGAYGYSEGLLFPVLAGLTTSQPDSLYLLDELPRNRPYTWVWTCDPNKRHGALLTAWDEDGNGYAVAEYYAEDLPDSIHADHYREIWHAVGVSEDELQVFADPGGAGAQAMLNLGDLGIFAAPVPKDAGSVKASIELIRRALWPNPSHAHPVTGVKGAPTFYFLRSLCSTWNTDGVAYRESRLLWELRQYRQKELAPPDTPVKANDDVADPLRYAFIVRPTMPDADDERWGAPPPKTVTTDHLSQVAAVAYEKAVKQLAKESRSGRRRM